MLRSPVEMGGIFLRRIDAAIVSSVSVKMLKSTNCARVRAKRHNGQSC